MLRSLARRYPKSSDYPDRVWQLSFYKRVLDGRVYDNLPYDFHEETTDGGEYIPIRDRAPSVRYPLNRVIVDDSVSLLFSEGHFPAIECESDAVVETLKEIVTESLLNSVMVEAAIRGSIGSVAILMRVLKGRLFFRVMDSIYLTPEWQADAPDTLARVTELYKVKGDALRAQGYPIADENLRLDYWFQRVWDDQEEVWFKPWLAGDRDAKAVRDAARTVRHALGFVPMVWIRNLPGGDDIDGDCTFRAAIETSIEIDYQLSQAGRGLKYSSDPLLLIKEPAAGDASMVRSASNAIVVSEKGDAKLLEIGGSAASAVIEYVRTLREFALEGVHGNRASPERMTAAQSGRALELMNQGLIWLTDNLRVSYGENGFLKLARMIVVASAKYPIVVRGKRIPALDQTARLALRWSRWYPSTAQDRAQDAQSLSTLADAGHISRETAVQSIAETYEINDIPAELARIDADRIANDTRLAAIGAQVKEQGPMPV